MNYSPLRYPGGKTKIAPLVYLLMQNAGVDGAYIEPFAGGGGVALSLLLSGKVQNIVINDYDRSIYAFWQSIVFDTDRFIRLIKKTPITIEEWHRQKNIFENEKCRSLLKLGFATFFLNRTNRSGILKAGPIGGYEQTGNYLIDVRFNKLDLIRKITRIAEHREHIEVYNLEIKDFIRTVIHNMGRNSFVYFDPPYYKKGKELYINFFQPEDHQEIANMIFDIGVDWMITYDNVNEIKKIYEGREQKIFDLNYSVANSGKNSEIIVLSRNIWPNLEELNQLKINLR